MASRKSSYFKYQNFYSLKDECLRKKVLFRDEYFRHSVPEAEWQRPHELCEEPHFFVGGASRFDVIQGHLGNCWLLVAMANLTMNPTLFNHVVPQDQSFNQDYAGIFHFRFWQCGDWVDVVVDDRLATRDGKLLFSHSKEKNEFWSALLEKAYTKLYGTYEELKGGWFTESMVDFTGGMVETVRLTPAPLNLDKLLLNAMEKSSFMCVYMKIHGACTADTKGLMEGHAYSVTNVRYVTLDSSSEKLLLLRLRNPWGMGEWTGAWSDDSSEWKNLSREEKDKLGLVSEVDGEFWMSLSDFKSHFEYIDICHLSPSTYIHTDDKTQKKLTWVEHMFKGEWIANVNAGGYSHETIHLNPQFRITLTQTDDGDANMCTLIIALMQKNARRNIWHRIGFMGFKIDDDHIKSSVLSKEYISSQSWKAVTTNFVFGREIVRRFKWPPGVHCIIPTTASPNREGKFLLRVFTEKYSIMESTEGTDEVVILTPDHKPGSESQTPDQPDDFSKTLLPENRGKHLEKLVYRSDQEVKAFFDRIADKNKEVGWEKLQSLLQFALSPNLGIFTNTREPKDVKFPKFECRTLIAMLDENKSGKLDFDEFQTLWSKIQQWESAFLHCGGNSEYIVASQLKQALIKAGFKVTSSALGTMVRLYADDEGRLTFNDFVMCAVELQTS